MNKFPSRLKSNWSACCSALMKPKATRSSRIVSYRTKTNLAVERCEPRLALDATQEPQGQQIDEFMDVIPATQHNWVGNASVVSSLSLFPSQLSFNALTCSEGLGSSAEAARQLVSAGSATSPNLPVHGQAITTSTNGRAAGGHLGMTDEFASGEISIPKYEVSSNGSVQSSLTSLSQFEPTEVSLVGEKQPKASNEGSSLTTSLSKHHHTDPAVLHVSSLQTISFDSARPVFRADQVFTVLASNDGTQVAMPQSHTTRGEPSSAGFLDVQATIAGIDSAQKTLFEAVVFDTKNGSSLFQENALHGNTNSMPVMARATLFEVAEHRVPPLPREVLGGHEGHENDTDGGKTVASMTSPHDTLVASGDADDWASRDLSLYVRLSLAAAFATTTFELDKRYRSTGSSVFKPDDVNPKQKRVLR